MQIQIKLTKFWDGHPIILCRVGSITLSHGIEIMKDEPLISIIMNCYNGEKYLNEAVESILSQTFSNWELIFFDNLSNDNTFSVIENYKDERIKYFLSNIHYNILYEARIEAVNHSNGEYLSFLDVDDWWENDKLKNKFHFLKINL